MLERFSSESLNIVRGIAIVSLLGMSGCSRTPEINTVDLGLEVEFSSLYGSKNLIVDAEISCVEPNSGRMKVEVPGSDGSTFETVLNGDKPFAYVSQDFDRGILFNPTVHVGCSDDDVMFLSNTFYDSRHEVTFRGNGIE